MATELKDVMAYVLLHHRKEWNHGLTNSRLNNVVYLCDWRHALKFGRQITAIHWRLSKHADSGAYVRDFENAAGNHHDLFRISHEPGGGRYFSLKDDAFQPRIGAEARETMDLVIRETKNLTPDQFIAKVNNSYPVSSSSQPQQQLNLLDLAQEYQDSLQRKQHMASVTTEPPGSDEFYFAVLDWANKTGEIFSLPDAEKAMVAYFKLSRAQQNRMARGGNIECYKDRTRWAVTNLHGAGMLDRDGAANYEITQFGRQELAASNGKITTDYLRWLKENRQISLEPKRRKAPSERDANSATHLPRSDEFYYAVLDWANEFSRKFTRSDVETAMAGYFKLTPEQQNQMTRGGNVERYRDRTRWAVTHLHGAGMLERHGVSNYKITAFGRMELAASNGKLTSDYLYNLKKKKQTSQSPQEPQRRKNRSEWDTHSTTQPPRSDEFYYAVLDWANQGVGKFSRRDVERAMVAYFKLTPEQQNQMTRGGNIECYRDRTRWAVTHLHGAGMLERHGVSNYKITAFGRRELADSNGEFTTAYLRGLKRKRQ